jgi:hypothetical protein
MHFLEFSGGQGSLGMNISLANQDESGYNLIAESTGI